jgi:hypothetical protein
MTDPFPVHPIYDQLIREEQERQRPEQPATEWPADDDPEEPSA